MVQFDTGVDAELVILTGTLGRKLGGFVMQIRAFLLFLIIGTAPAFAADFHQVTTQAQFTTEVVGKVIENEKMRKVFSSDGRVSGETIDRAVPRRKAVPGEKGKRNLLRRPLPDQPLRFYSGIWEWSDRSICIRQVGNDSDALFKPCWAVLISGDQLLFVDRRGKGEGTDLYRFTERAD